MKAQLFQCITVGIITNSSSKPIIYTITRSTPNDYRSLLDCTKHMTSSQAMVT